MRKIIGLILALLLIFCPAAALAEETPTALQSATPSAEPSATPAPQAESGSVSVDASHIYTGMKRSYADGYAPTASGGKALVVLPLLAQNVSGPLTVTVGLGDPTSAPFVYRNYEKQFSKKAFTFADGAVDCYLVSFSLPLVRKRVDGNYPVTLAIAGQAADGNAVSATFTLYVAITDGKDPNAPTPTPKPEQTAEPQPKPKLMVESYSLDKPYLEAGGSATLTVTVRNTSAAQLVKNVKLSFTEESGEILPAGTGAGYYKEIAKNGTVTWTVQLNATTGAQSKPHIAAIAMEYEDGEGTALNASDRAVIEVRQSVRLEYEEPSLPTRLTQGDTPTFSINLMNMGKSALNNVLLTFDIPGLSNGGSVLVGTIAPGEAKTGTTNFQIAKAALGSIAGTFTLSYEDEYGEHYKKELPLATTIEKKTETAAPADSQKAAVKALIPWWVPVACGVLCLIALCVFVPWWLKRRRERQRDEIRL
jgi:hypothetical protein